MGTHEIVRGVPPTSASLIMPLQPAPRWSCCIAHPDVYAWHSTARIDAAAPWRLIASLRSTLQPWCRDVVTDTVHQFAPAYHDYVLYSDGTRKATTPPKTVRTRTFVAGGCAGEVGLALDRGCSTAAHACRRAARHACLSPCSDRLGWTSVVNPLDSHPGYPAPALILSLCAVGQESSQQHSHGDQLLMNMELGECACCPKVSCTSWCGLLHWQVWSWICISAADAGDVTVRAVWSRAACVALHAQPAPRSAPFYRPNPHAGGTSTWTKSSSGGPPAPGATSEGEEGLGGVAGLEPLASSEDQGLTGPRYTLR